MLVLPKQSADQVKTLLSVHHLANWAVEIGKLSWVHRVEA
jgi:hypothetical protein